MAKTVLIAEDEAFIVESLTFLLSREGYEVKAVADGGEALDVLARERPDLFVLDIMMPKMNGFDVLRKLRGTMALEDLPVLVLTAKGQEADRRRMIDLGANDFVTKPYANADLLERVRGLLDDSGSPPAAVAGKG